MMRSPRSKSSSRALRNPTLIAMLGSAGIHGALAIFSVLHPAESQTNHLRIVSIAPQPVAPKSQGTGLPVPNSLPPINLGKVPQLPPIPSTSAIKIPSSMYIPPSGSLKLPKITNPPIRSFAPPSLANPNGAPGSIGTLVPPNVPTGNNDASTPSSPSGRATPDYSQYSVPRSSNLPKLASEEFQKNSESLYARSSPPSPSETPPGTASVGDTSSEVRTQARTWLQAQERRYGQKFSLQAGQSLTADYPIEACASQQQGVARVVAIYGPNGTVATREIIELAPNPILDKAAIAEVDRFRPEAASVYQAFNFMVRIPYSTKVCEAAQPKPSPTPPPSSEASDRPSSTPQPSAPQLSNPHPSSNSVPQPSFPSAKPLPEPKGIAPAEPIPPDQVQPPPQAPQPQPSATANPAPSGAAGSLESNPPSSTVAPSLEPLPNPSIVPESPKP